MAPTCDLMIKIVKVNRLYLNSLLVSIVNRVSRSGRVKYQCENTDESNKKWLLKEGTFFIGGRGVGRGILEIFCQKESWSYQQSKESFSETWVFFQARTIWEPLL